MELEFELKLENVHVIILSLTAIAIILADHDAVAYLRGKKPLLDLRRVRRLHYAVTTGLIGMVVSGAALFYDAWGELIEEPTFYIKMLFVLALIVNGVVVGKLMSIATRTPFSDLSDSQQSKLLMSGAVSGLGWVGAATIGLFFL